MCSDPKPPAPSACSVDPCMADARRCYPGRVAAAARSAGLSRGRDVDAAAARPVSPADDPAESGRDGRRHYRHAGSQGGQVRRLARDRCIRHRAHRCTTILLCHARGGLRVVPSYSVAVPVRLFRDTAIRIRRCGVLASARRCQRFGEVPTRFMQCQTLRERDRRPAREYQPDAQFGGLNCQRVLQGSHGGLHNGLPRSRECRADRVR